MSAVRVLPAAACAVTLALLIAGSPASGQAARRSQGPASAVTLAAFLLQPSGILFGLHPTEARITITATAAAPLKVCQFGTSFSSYWNGGCRRLGGQPLTLPNRGGAVPIGFRGLPC